MNTRNRSDRTAQDYQEIDGKKLAKVTIATISALGVACFWLVRTDADLREEEERNRELQVNTIITEQLGQVPSDLEEKRIFDDNILALLELADGTTCELAYERHSQDYSFVIPETIQIGKCS
jgi:ribonuclease PH